MVQRLSPQNLSHPTHPPTPHPHRFVTAAKATTEECKVVRKYGVESETVVTLFNPADFFAAAAESGGTATAGECCCPNTHTHTHHWWHQHHNRSSVISCFCKLGPAAHSQPDHLVPMPYVPSCLPLCLSAGASASSTGADGDLGVNPAAGWFSTMFPVASSLKKGKRVQFMPKGVLEAVQKAIKESTIDLTLEVKKKGVARGAPAAAEGCC